MAQLKTEILRKIGKLIDTHFPDEESLQDSDVQGLLEQAVGSFAHSIDHTMVDGRRTCDNIAIWWNIDDVQAEVEGIRQRSKASILHVLEPSHMHEILHRCKHVHDASQGINWDVITCVSQIVADEIVKEEGAA